MSSLRQMTEAEYAVWQAEIVPAYAQDKVQAGQWTQQEALAKSADEFEALLPAGLATTENYLYTIVDTAGQAAGVLWFAVNIKFDERIAYVYDVAINPSHQREGLAYRAFLDLNAEVRSLGLSGIALHVFGHNKAAQALYAKLGFEATNIHLYKAVGAAGS